MKEILEMKRVHDRLSKKRLLEREKRQNERQQIREKIFAKREAANQTT